MARRLSGEVTEAWTIGIVVPGAGGRVFFKEATKVQVLEPTLRCRRFTTCENRHEIKHVPFSST